LLFAALALATDMGPVVVSFISAAEPETTKEEECKTHGRVE